MLWRPPFIFENCKLTAENRKQTAKNENKWRPPKHILALPTWGKKCVFSELKPFELANFDLGHPVVISGTIQFTYFINFFKNHASGSLISSI